MCNKLWIVVHRGGCFVIFCFKVQLLFFINLYSNIYCKTYNSLIFYFNQKHRFHAYLFVCLLYFNISFHIYVAFFVQQGCNIKMNFNINISTYFTPRRTDFCRYQIIWYTPIPVSLLNDYTISIGYSLFSSKPHGLKALYKYM